MSVREPLHAVSSQTQLRPNDHGRGHVSADAGHRSAVHAQSRRRSSAPINPSKAASSTTRRGTSSKRTTSRYPTDEVERIRNDVVMGALRGAGGRGSASLREGRKSIIFVSEGFTAMLPPQMRRDRTRRSRPIRSQAALRRGRRTARSSRPPSGSARPTSTRGMRDVYDDGQPQQHRVLRARSARAGGVRVRIRRHPGGPPSSFATDRRALQMTQDTLRSLSEETDGRAIVNRNTLEKGLAADGARLELLLPARLQLDAGADRRQVPRD